LAVRRSPIFSAAVHAALAGYPYNFASPAIARVPTFVVLDQSKAFERLSHPWLDKVLQRWGVPCWLRRGLMDQVVDRTVVSGAWGARSAPRLLRRGIGLGGTANTLLRNVAFDPVFTAVEAVTGAPIRAYVDE
ncbi:MAG: hypothetical protein ACKPKO_60900, partial [Candidatus Fonsibacter sp.]